MLIFKMQADHIKANYKMLKQRKGRIVSQLTRENTVLISCNVTWIRELKIPWRMYALCILVTQLCLTLSDPMDYSLPGFSIHGIFQAKILEQVAIPFSRGSSDPGIKPRSPALQVISLPPEPPGKPIILTRHTKSL